jgi:Sigma-70 region 2
MRAETGETELRGGFPETRASAVAGVRSADGEVRHRSHTTIITVYWKPVYKYLRLRWGESHEAAQDLTQEFFARAIEKSFFAGFDPGKARFRTYLRTCVDAMVANERQASQRLKRGGGAVTFSLDFEGAEAEIDRLGATDSNSLDSVFGREWVRSLFSTACACNVSRAAGPSSSICSPSMTWRAIPKSPTRNSAGHLECRRPRSRIILPLVAAIFAASSWRSCAN